MVDVTEFAWGVPEGGFRWIKSDVGILASKPGPQWLLTFADGLPRAYRVYRPLKSETGLYRRFIDIDFTDRESILGFANRYGNLGLAASSLGGLDESWDKWKAHIMMMRRTVSTWDMVKAKDVKGLSARICEDSPHTWVFRDVTERSEYSDTYVDHRKLFVPGNPLVPAGFFVERWTNTSLMHDTHPALVYDVERARRALRIVSRSLLSAMWLQFAQTIDGTRSHRPCKECSGWFEVSTEDTGKRANREFCSDACKSKNYRRRKAEALELKAKGETVTSIAKKLGTDPQTIKTWVSTKKG